MRYIVTNKVLKQNFGSRLYAITGELKFLKECKESMAYTQGSFGWNADFYELGDVGILMGNRPTGTLIPSCIIDRYNELFDKGRDCNALLDDFLKEIKSL